MRDVLDVQEKGDQCQESDKMTLGTETDCCKCEFDGMVFCGKKSKNAHFLEKHPDVVRGIIEYSYFEVKTPRQQKAWASGEAAFLHCRSCKGSGDLEERE
jgi:hypothetical protein